MNPVKRFAMLLVGSAALMLVAARDAAAEFVIDDFDTDQFIQVTGPPPGLKVGDDTVNAAEAAGGERDVKVTRTSANSGSVAVDVNQSVAGILSYASGAATTGSAIVSWDGDDNTTVLNHTGLGGADVTGGGVNTHVALKATSDLGGSIVVTFFTDAGNASAYTIAVPGIYPAYQDFLVPLASFVSVLGGGADFSNIGAITMELVGTTPNLDLSVDVISVLNPSAVPEPSLVWLLGAGVGMFGLQKLWARFGSKPTGNADA